MAAVSACGMSPETWRRLPLGDVASVRSEKHTPSADDVGVPCVELAGIEKGTGRILSVSRAAGKLSAKNVFYKGDVLYGKLRPNLRKCAFPPFDGVCSSDILVFAVDGKICLGEYVFYTAQTDKFTALACQTMGTKMPRADWDVLRNFPMAIPPISIQGGVVSILRKWDSAIEKTERLIAALEARFEWLLKALIGDRQGNPELRKARLEDIANMSSGGTPTSSNEAYYGGDIPWISIADMTASSKYLTETKKKLSKLGLQNGGGALFPKGTIFLAMYASIGECVIASVPAATSQAILGINAKKGLLQDYLYYALVSMKGRMQAMRQTGTQPNLNGRIVKDCGIFMPTLQNQEKIVKTLNTAWMGIDYASSLANQYRAQKRGIMQRLINN